MTTAMGRRYTTTLTNSHDGNDNPDDSRDGNDNPTNLIYDNPDNSRDGNDNVDDSRDRKTKYDNPDDSCDGNDNPTGNIDDPDDSRDGKTLVKQVLFRKPRFHAPSKRMKIPGPLKDRNEPRHRCFWIQGSRRVRGGTATKEITWGTSIMCANRCWIHVMGGWRAKEAE
jgi:hypothetical protein